MSDFPGISGKTVLVTGSARGIGHETARVLLERGATVLLTDLTQSSLEQAAAHLPSRARIGLRPANLTRGNDVKELFAWAESEHGGVDHLVNNAGIVTQGKLEDFSDEDWAKVLDINLTAVYRCSKAYLRLRLARKLGGAIVNVSSMSYRGMTQQIAYSASKGGVVTLTKSTALEMARHGIRSNCVAPGMTETAMTAVEEQGSESLRQRMLEMIPMRRYAQPREIATVIAFLLSDDASYMTGEVLHVAGGGRL